MRYWREGEKKNNPLCSCSTFFTHIRFLLETLVINVHRGKKNLLKRSNWRSVGAKLLGKSTSDGWTHLLLFLLCFFWGGGMVTVSVGMPWRATPGGRETTEHRRPVEPDRRRVGGSLEFAVATAGESVAAPGLEDGSDFGGEMKWSVMNGDGGRALGAWRVESWWRDFGGAQLLRSSSVAVSTSQDLDDKAAITAFCTEGGTADLRRRNPLFIFFPTTQIGFKQKTTEMRNKLILHFLQ